MSNSFFYFLLILTLLCSCKTVDSNSARLYLNLVSEVELKNLRFCETTDLKINCLSEKKFKNGNYSLEKAYVYLHLAKLEYQLKDIKEQEKLNIVKSNIVPDFFKYDAVEFYEQNGESALLIFNGKTINLIIRGTDQAEDWAKNFNALPSSLSISNAMQGFSKASEDLYKWLLKSLRDKNADDNFMYFFNIIGHSRGGGIAKLLAERFKRSTNLFLLNVYTFAAPNPETVFLAQDNRNLNHSVYNLKLLHDPVAWLPRRLEEIGTSKIYKWDDKNNSCEQLDKVGVRPLSNVNHHYLAIYQKCLEFLL